MSIDEQYTIDTPENIEFRYTVAGIGSRFLAAIVDTLLLLLVQVVLIVTLLMIGAALENVGGLEDQGRSVLFAVWAILSFAFFWGYYIFFEMMWNGQSPGKRSGRLRVVREGGRPVTFVASAIRNLVRVIDFLPSLYGLGVLVMFVDRRSRRLGDLAGGTLVVKDRAPVSLEGLKSQSLEHKAATGATRLLSTDSPAPDNDSSTFTPSIPNLHLLTNDDYDLVQEFLRRRSELGRESRERLGRQLVERLGSRLAISVSPSNSESFLEHLVSEYRLLRR